MAAVRDHKTLGAPFSDAKSNFIRVQYVGAVDGLAQADLDLLTAREDLLIRHVGTRAVAALTSGGSAVLDLGVGAGGVQFLSDSAYAGYTLAAFVNGATEAFKKLPSGSKIVLGIEGADLTAGTLEFLFEVARFTP
jgi:hypothetical protein